MDSSTHPANQNFWSDARPSNENPDFIRHYFASSRLHFIGSFRARYESMMVAVGKKLSVNPATLLQSSATAHTLSKQTAQTLSERVIVHVDMDCFFASIAVKKNPSLAGKCIAVAHGGGEISSCSYEARKFGVRAGMFCKDARKICPQLLSVPYDFPMYEEASIQIYTLFYGYPHICVEAVSVDEAYLDITLAVSGGGGGSQSAVEELVSELRGRIYAKTGCTASAGIGPSKLVARLATKAAKPNGQLRIRQECVIAYLDTLQVRDLPGIGWRTAQRLKQLEVQTCSQLRALSLAFLQTEFGERHGQLFYEVARGIDVAPVRPLKPRKSIGAEVSWGVRFTNDEGEKVSKFLSDLADEVSSRVLAAGACGSKVVFKVYKRRPNGDMTYYKHLGHGPCTILTRSAKFAEVSQHSLRKTLRATCLRLHADLHIWHEDLRGVGLQITDLKFADLSFDYTAAPTSGDTRRIDSYFEAKGNVKEQEDVSKGGRHDLRKEGKSERVGIEWNQIGVNDELKFNSPTSEDRIEHGRLEVEGEVQDDSEASFWTQKEMSEDDQENDTDCEANNLDIEEDRIEIGPAEEAEHVIPNLRRQQNAVNIPSGWDKQVFLQLPEELQEELLAANSTTHNRPTNEPVTHNAPFRNENTDYRRSERRKRRRNGTSTRNEHPRLEKRHKRKQTAQVTMTQFADISELKSKGNDVLDAKEFRNRPLRDCVELLADLRGGSNLLKKTAALNSSSVRKGNTIRTDATLRRNDELDNENELEIEIPSPPTLSSDSSYSLGISGILEEQGMVHEQVYEEEDVTEYAPKLQEWMKRHAREVKSGYVELLRGRLLELVRLKKLERVCSELRVMGIYADREREGGWRKWIKVLVDEVQSECRRLYGFSLAIRAIEM